MCRGNSTLGNFFVNSSTPAVCLMFTLYLVFVLDYSFGILQYTKAKL